MANQDDLTIAQAALGGDSAAVNAVLEELPYSLAVLLSKCTDSDSEEKAREIISVAIQRYAGDHTFENTTTAEKLLFELESKHPTPPSEETVARLNAIGREYPFCAYMKQKNLYLL